MVYCANLYSLPLPHLQESSILTPLLYSSNPSSSASTDNAVFLAPQQGKSRLFPPPHTYSCHPLPLHCVAQVQNRLPRNILQNRILNSPNVGFHWLKPCLLYRRLRQGVLPSSVQPPPWHPPNQSPCHMVLETSQDPSYTGGNHPRLCNKYKYRLDGDLKKSGHPRPCPQPAQDHWHSMTNRPFLCQV